MGEAWEAISKFLASGTEAAEGGAEEAAVQTPKATDIQTPLDTPKNETGKKIVKQDKPALEVIDGGQADKPAKKKTPLQKTVEVADDIPTNLPDLPTPGGISLVLILVLFILFTVAKLPKGGTRLQLLFKAMMGQVSTITPGVAQASGQGSSLPQITPGHPYGMSLHTGLGLSNYGDY